MSAIKKHLKRFVLVGFIAFMVLYIYGFTSIPSALLDKSAGYCSVKPEVTRRSWTVNATLSEIVREYVQKEEILTGRPTIFLTEHMSPCWTTSTKKGFFESLVSPTSGAYRVDCLPAFYIAGFIKCATTDLWFRLLKHPQIYGSNRETDIHSRDLFTRKKEVYFWDKKLFTRDMTFREYLDYFSGVPKNQLTGEATPFTIFSSFARNSSILSKLSSKSQRALQNAEVLAPHIINEVSPNSKFIIIMREPGDRSLSAYLHVHRASELLVEDRPHHPAQPSPQDFHERVLQQVKLFRECTERNSERTCAYDANVRDSDWHAWTFLHGGYYATYIRDTLKTVSWDKLLFLRYEDYRLEKKATLCKILKFLNVKHDQQTIDHMHFDLWNVIGWKSHTEKFQMLPETREILTDFYRPMNEDLARLLNDDRFKFKDILDRK